MNDPHLEQGVIDSFRRLMEAHGAFHDAIWDSFSLGGQDRKTASDYIFSDSSNFCLIEFKNRKGQLYTEAQKLIARLLCESLSTDAHMRSISEKCHHIAWEDLGDIVSAPYVDIVCCKDNFPESSCTRASSDFTNRRASGLFCDGFNSPPPQVNIEFDEFLEYIDFLMELSGGSSNDLVVIADNVDVIDSAQTKQRPAGLVVKRLKGVTAIKDWIDSKRPASKPTHPRSFSA